MILRTLGAATLSVLLVATLAVVVLLDTTTGARWLSEEISASSGGRLRFAGVQGRIAAGLRIERLEFAADGLTVRADSVRLDLVLVELLRGRLVIDTLAAGEVAVARAADEDAPPAAGPWRMPAFSTPWPVELRALDIGTLRWNGDALVVGQLHLAAALQGSALTVRELRGVLSGVALRLAGRAELAPELPLEAELQWRAAALAVSGAGTVSGDLRQLQLEHWLRVPDAVRVTARVEDPAGAARVDGIATWDRLGLRVPGFDAVQATAGRLVLEGSLSGWRAQLESGVQAARLPASALRAAVRGTPAQAIIEEASLAGPAGTLTITGASSLSAPVSLQVDARVRDFDMGVVRAGLDGRLSATARVEATLPDAVKVRLATLSGRVMGRRVSGSGDIGYQAGLVTLRRVILRSGANRLEADGTVGERLAGRFELEAPELAALWPGLGGRVAARATLAGTATRPVIDLDAQGAALALDGNRIGDLELHLDVDRAQRAALRLDARGVTAAGLELGGVQGRLSGTVAAHQLRLQLNGADLALDVDSAGGWDGRTLRHVIGAASVAEARLGRWTLLGAPTVSLRGGAADVGAHCWLQGEGRLCIDALMWSDMQARLAARLANFDLRGLAPWFPADVALDGHADAEVDVERADAAWRGAAAWRQDGSTLWYTGGDEPLEISFERSRLELEFLPGILTARLDVSGPQGVTAAGSATLALPFDPQAPFLATLQAVLPDVAPLVPLLPIDMDLAEVAGRITIDLAADGSLNAPRLTGAARLSAGAMALTDLGVKVEGINLALLGDGSPVLRLQGVASAGGRLSLAGVFEPFAPQGPAGRLRVRGNNIDAVRLPDRHVQASPDLTLLYDSGGLAVAGGVTIANADIVIRALPQSARSPSPDAVVVDRDTAPAVAPAAVVAGELAIEFGRDVRLRAFGLDTRLAGTLRLSQAADGSPHGFGVVRLVDGRIGAYGKQLMIERGTLGFTGPLDDPIVDLRAVREIDWEGRQVRAGLLLSGTTSRPQSRVFSEPAMGEADALSFLISGRPLQTTGEGDRSAIAGAVMAFGVQQTSPLTQQLGSAITLDELGVQGGSMDEAEIVAGKQLGSDLYLRFSYGLFNRIGTVLARYRLGRNVSIEATSGEEQSLDLVYSIDRP